MKQIPLYGKNGKGFYAVVDDEDYSILSRYRWNYWHGAVLRTFLDHGKCHVWYMHRIIMNPRRGFEVDHINGDPLDNRKENLRVARHRDNLQNIKMSKKNTSGYTGVWWNKAMKKWAASIRTRGEQRYLGAFDTKEDAYKAYLKEAVKVRGRFLSKHLQQDAQTFL